METSGVKSEMTSHSPALLAKALRTFSVEVTISASGPAAARRPGLDATDRRVAHAGGTWSAGHGFGRILSFLGPSAPCPRARNPRCCEMVSYRRGVQTWAQEAYLCREFLNLAAHLDGRRAGRHVVEGGGEPGTREVGPQTLSRWCRSAQCAGELIGGRARVHG